MSHRFIFVPVAALVCGLAGAQSNPTTYVTSTYNKLIALMKKKDSAGMNNLLRSVAAPDFEYISQRGERRKLDEMLSRSKDQFKYVKQVSAATATVTTAFVRGKTAQYKVVTSYTVAFSDPNGKSHTATISGSSADTWSSIGGAWKLRSTRSIGEKVIVDGVNRTPKGM